MTIPPNPRVGIYLRVSTADQKFESQIEAIKGYCRARRWRRLRWIREKASGADAKRTQLDHLMQCARAGQFDVIAVYKFDRLGRSLSHQLQILAELTRLKIAFIATSEGIDTAADDATTRLHLNILGSVGEHQREQIVERVRAGLKAARRRGVRLGRPGIDAETTARIVKLRNQANPAAADCQPMPFALIAKKLGVSAATACRVCQAHEKALQKPLPEKRGAAAR